jgi:hypothetical protein
LTPDPELDVPSPVIFSGADLLGITLFFLGGSRGGLIDPPAYMNWLWYHNVGSKVPATPRHRQVVTANTRTLPESERESAGRTMNTE